MCYIKRPKATTEAKSTTAAPPITPHPKLSALEKKVKELAATIAAGEAASAKIIKEELSTMAEVLAGLTTQITELRADFDGTAKVQTQRIGALRTEHDALAGTVSDIFDEQVGVNKDLKAQIEQSYNRSVTKTVRWPRLPQLRSRRYHRRPAAGLVRPGPARSGPRHTRARR